MKQKADCVSLYISSMIAYSNPTIGGDRLRDIARGI